MATEAELAPEPGGREEYVELFRRYARARAELDAARARQEQLAAHCEGLLAILRWAGRGRPRKRAGLIERLLGRLGRDPEREELVRSGLFDAEHYLEAYPDVAAVGMDPLEHFLQFGWREGRSPGPRFDVPHYLRTNPAVAEAGDNPVLHYVRRGRAEGRTATPREAAQGRARDLLAAYRRAVGEAAPPGAGDERRVDVVVPVFEAFAETRACLESVLSQPQETPFDLVVVDDGSRDPRLLAYLARLEEAGRILLLRNAANEGFVRSANRGLLLHPGRDVVLLNSDTEVANDWLDRLRACACSRERVGSVSPMTNRGTLCSFPQTGVDNPMPVRPGLDEIDRAFRSANRGRAVEVPTTVGFCMYVRRAAMREVGVFDAGRFGRGYGEENDFCLRAEGAGFTHLVAADVFVGHAGEASFGGEGSLLRSAAERSILELYPDYSARVAAFMRADPLRPLRLAAELRLLAEERSPLVALVGHGRGGGTDRHIDELAALLGARARFLLLQPRAGQPGRFEVLTLPGRTRLNLPADGVTYEELVETLGSVRPARLHFQHLLGWPAAVLDLPRRLGVRHDFTAHDFHTLCPRVHMTRDDEGYCGEPGASACAECAPGPGDAPGDAAMREEALAAFLQEADRVFCPTWGVARRLRERFPSARLVVADHPDREVADLDRPPRWSHRPGETLKVVLLGALNDLKGRTVALKVAARARTLRLPVRFVVVGWLEGIPAGAAHSHLDVLGRYEEEDLDRVLRAVAPHVAWLPAQIPESYSYTLSAALRHALPVVASGLGALGERLAGRPLTWKRPWDAPVEEWTGLFARLAAGDLPVEDRTPAPRPPSFRYRSDYLRGNGGPRP